MIHFEFIALLKKPTIETRVKIVSFIINKNHPEFQPMHP